MALPTVDKPPAKPDPANRPPSGRTKRALDLMVHDGLTDNEAAVQVGITVTAIRLAIQKRGVRAYLNEQREVSRARICARNMHRLAEIRDKADNMPAVNAIRLLEQLPDDAAIVGQAQRNPGVVIIVNGGHANVPLAQNAAKPLIINGDDSDA